MKKDFYKVFALLFILIVMLACKINLPSKKTETVPPTESEVLPTSTKTAIQKSITPEPDTPEPLKNLVFGDESSDVLLVEEKLRSLGYAEVGLVDGVFDRQTEAALNHFLLMSNLPITGQIDEMIWDALMSPDAAPYYYPPAFPGKIPSVDDRLPICDDHALQDRLAVLEYIMPGSQEWSIGSFGSETRDALIEFQNDTMPEADGVADLDAWQILFSPIPHWTFGGAAVKVHRWPTFLYPAEQDVVAQVWDGSRLWLAVSRGSSIYENFLIRIDPGAHPAEAVMVIRTRDCETQYAAITNMAFAGGKIWLLYDSDENGNPEPLLQSVDPAAGIFNKPFRFADCPDGYCVPASAMGASNNQLWVAGGDRAYSIDATSGKVLASRPIGFVGTGKMVYDGQCFWYQGEAMVTSFNPLGGKCRSSNEDLALYYGQPETNGELVWVINYDGTISQHNLDTGVTISVGTPLYSPAVMTFGNGLLWIADNAENKVIGYSPENNSFGEAIQLQGESPDHLLIESGNLWVHFSGSGIVEEIDIKDYQTSTSGYTATPSPTQPVLTRTLSLKTPNMEGEDIRLLQEALQTLSYYEFGVVDGVFGSLTDEAVRQFQSDHGLVVDGVVGPITWKELFQ